MNPARASAVLAAVLGSWSLFWYLVLHPTGWIAALALALPALLCVLPAWRGVRLALGAAGFVAFGYLAHGAMELVANPLERGAALVSTVLALALLVSTSHALRALRPVRPAAPI